MNGFELDASGSKRDQWQAAINLSFHERWVIS